MEMKDAELFELLEGVAQGDLTEGSDIFDHPCSIAVRRIKDKHSCQYCSGQLDSTELIGVYECPKCIKEFPNGKSVRDVLHEAKLSARR